MKINVEMTEAEYEEFKLFQASLRGKPFIWLQKYDWVYDKLIFVDDKSFNIIKDDAYKQIEENRDHWFKKTQELEAKLKKKKGWFSV